MSTLEIRGLHAGIAGKQILNGIDLTIESGRVDVVMGPNGAGKSTLAGVLMGRPGYEVISGSVTLDGEDVLALPAWKRAQAGLHLVMQYPSEVPGVSLDHVMAEALGARGRSVDGLDVLLADEARRIGFSSELLHRSLNVDLSGGEKKRNETLQLAVLRPGSPCSTSSTRVSTSTRCATARAVSRTSRTTTARLDRARRARHHPLQPACSRSFAPTASTSS
jgi:Fe-S cluster assembly ATP-binding protein